MLATLTAGESLLKVRHMSCIFHAFQRTHLQMHKQYANKVSMVVTVEGKRRENPPHLAISQKILKTTSLPSYMPVDQQTGDPAQLKDEHQHAIYPQPSRMKRKSWTNTLVGKTRDLL